MQDQSVIQENKPPVYEFIARGHSGKMLYKSIFRDDIGLDLDFIRVGDVREGDHRYDFYAVTVSQENYDSYLRKDETDDEETIGRRKDDILWAFDRHFPKVGHAGTSNSPDEYLFRKYIRNHIKFVPFYIAELMYNVFNYEDASIYTAFLIPLSTFLFAERYAFKRSFMKKKKVKLLDDMENTEIKELFMSKYPEEPSYIRSLTFDKFRSIFSKEAHGLIEETTDYVSNIFPFSRILK